MRNLQQIKTMMDAWCFDNKRYVNENAYTYAEHIIAECEATDWNWFFEKGITDLTEVKEFLNQYGYYPIILAEADDLSSWDEDGEVKLWAESNLPDAVGETDEIGFTDVDYDMIAETELWYKVDTSQGSACSTNYDQLVKDFEKIKSQ